MAAMIRMSEEDLNALRAAAATLEHPGLAARLGNIAGKPIELVGRALPEAASEAVAAATTKALHAALAVPLLRRAPASPTFNRRDDLNPSLSHVSIPMNSHMTHTSTRSARRPLRTDTNIAPVSMRTLLMPLIRPVASNAPRQDANAAASSECSG
jgi:hypothetical protein